MSGTTVDWLGWIRRSVSSNMEKNRLDKCVLNASICILRVRRELGIERRYNWRSSPYYMIIHDLQTVLHLYRIQNRFLYTRSDCTSDKYFLLKWSTRLQSVYSHMVGRTASVISLFYSWLPGSQRYPLRLHIVPCKGAQLTVRKIKISQSSLTK